MELTPEQVNEFLANAILKSQIGKAVQEAVAKVVEKASRTWDNPFEKAIENHLYKLVDEELRTTFIERIRDIARQRIEAALTAGATEKIIDSLVKKLTSESYQ